MQRPNVSKLLLDIVDAADMLAESAGDVSLDQYLSNRATRWIVERGFILIGEALAQLSRTSPEVAEEIVSCREIIAFRNILVHGYALVDDRVVWTALHRDLPVLRTQVQNLLDRKNTG